MTDLTEEQLTALRPAPRRDPELVAARAQALGLTAHRPAIGRLRRAWPLLITAGGTGVYLVAAAVIR